MRTVAVTGGARGIGRATAAAVVAAGGRVAIGDRDGDLAQEVAEGLGASAVAATLDVCDPASFAAFLDDAEARLGTLDALVNNAGVMHTGSFAQESPERADRMLAINLGGVLTGSRLATQRFLPRRRGHIVNVASMAGKTGFAGGVSYSAAKFGVVGLSEALRAELRDSGVKVSLVLPAAVRTELTSGLRESRLAPLIEPAVVADAIVGALESGRFEVYAPRSVGPATNVMAMLPRGARDRLARALGADRYLLDADVAVRGAYAERIARS